ncbi:MAG: cytochrome C [Deltaproteobacteria bacterium HGW-Deltaproteobacteria-4]|nr:MAG: cytochrome C [Deltaproteobacteria bacterium HGW-Deltaproteobacteria-4]
MKKRDLAILVGFSLCVFFGGCDSVNRHKVLTTIFDGVPAPPPPGQVCEEYAQQRLAAALAGGDGETVNPATLQAGSEHPPYRDKHCDDCHARTQSSGFVTAQVEDLCFVCHKDFIKGKYVHGPVSASACLFCHDPHSSRNPALLKAEKSAICQECHNEARVAAGMHNMVSSRNIECVNCHNPHYGNAPNFLK